MERIEAALQFWNRLFGGSGTADAGALWTLGRTVAESDAGNIDTLLEVSTALSIARAGTQADREDWPTSVPWKLESVDDGDASYPAIRLRSGGLICEIAKGTPRVLTSDGSRAKVADLLSAWADETLPSNHSGKARGRQPDIVVMFWLESQPGRCAFVLADAKRNATRDGETYLRASLDVAATYLMSFGYRMGLTLPGLDGGAITTALKPAVTIFCRQSTGRNAQSATAVLRTDTHAPVVMAFDLEQHFSPAMRPWHSPVLAAWLGSLGRQAIRILERNHEGIAVGRRPRR